MTKIVNHGNNAPDARTLLLNLLGVSGGRPLTAADAIAACALFDISETSVRVTLVRLSRSGLVESPDRGIYALGPAGRMLATEVAQWRTAEARLTAWDGRWIAAATGGTLRSDRKRLRARDRALALTGMRELVDGLFVRPDNLVDGVEGARHRLRSLGLGEEAVVFRADALAPQISERAMTLWREPSADEDYAIQTARLDAWMTHADSLPLETAARESFLLGDAAIRRIVFDPLLPDPFVDVSARRRFIAATARFDDMGRRIWGRFFDGAGRERR